MLSTPGSLDVDQGSYTFFTVATIIDGARIAPANSKVFVSLFRFLYKFNLLNASCLTTIMQNLECLGAKERVRERMGSPWNQLGLGERRRNVDTAKFRAQKMTDACKSRSMSILSPS
jgi:hypothetical protein